MDIKKDVLCPQRIISYLPDYMQDICCEVYPVLSSTNDRAGELARNGNIPCLVLAEEQTHGRGRNGRDFYSPNGHGLYMSLAVGAPKEVEKLLGITAMAAVAVHRAIKNITGIQTGIKWVNDIYLNGRKVCGILAEAFSDSSGIKAVVVGIGINIDTSDFPEELKNTAGSLGSSDLDRSQLAAAIAGEFMDILGTEDRSYMDTYRQASIVVGKRVRYICGGKENTGYAEHIDDDCALVIINDNGCRTVLRSGEVTLRPEKEGEGFEG